MGVGTKRKDLRAVILHLAIAHGLISPNACCAESESRPIPSRAASSLTVLDLADEPIAWLMPRANLLRFATYRAAAAGTSPVTALVSAFL
jgi:hypothetical protein